MNPLLLRNHTVLKGMLCLKGLAFTVLQSAVVLMKWKIKNMNGQQ